MAEARAGPPAAERPTLISAIGLPSSAASSATAMNSRGRRSASTNDRTSLTSGSWTITDRSSTRPRSVSLPALAYRRQPIPSRLRRTSSEAALAPDCIAIATGPGGDALVEQWLDRGDRAGGEVADADRCSCRRSVASPGRPGPRARAPWPDRRRPSLGRTPGSGSPPALTPAWAHSLRASSVRSAFIAIMASSGTAGRVATDG